MSRYLTHLNNLNVNHIVRIKYKTLLYEKEITVRRKEFVKYLLLIIKITTVVKNITQKIIHDITIHTK